MKLKKFIKNKKQKKVIIGCGMGIVLLIGGLVLYRTFALYEEKKEFNILKGVIPEFSQEDIQLAFTIDGAKGEIFPNRSARYVGKSVTCENGATANWDNSSWSLTDINPNGNKKVNCSIAFATITEFADAKIGDYVSYTPSAQTFTISKDLTGYTSDQTINPSELNLWRVIKKNENGTIDLISEYLPSSKISFKGKIGYINYVYALNLLASSYEINGITIGSRHMGYDRQTQVITNTSKLETTTKPWKSGSYSILGKWDLWEFQGMGENWYITDFNLVKQACNLITPVINNKELTPEYYISSRYYTYDSVNDTNWRFGLRVVRNGTMNGIGGIYQYNDKKGYYEITATAYYRPIVVLKDNLSAKTGDGSASNPWQIN